MHVGLKTGNDVSSYILLCHRPFKRRLCSVYLRLFRRWFGNHYIGGVCVRTGDQLPISYYCYFQADTTSKIQL